MILEFILFFFRLFIFKKVIVWYYGGVLSRSERKIKDRFEKYDYFVSYKNYCIKFSKLDSYILL